jgi:peptidoglycan/xylan/chitin deacetylase (PgdA/CDA1 family)
VRGAGLAVGGGVIGGLVARPPDWAVRGIGRLLPGILFSRSTSTPLVALTLDDGPHRALTPRVLEVLERHGASATFFLLGSRAAAAPALVRRLQAEGHEVGNHLWEDRPSALLSPAEFERQLVRTHRSLAGGSAVRLFRPGSGWVTPGQLAIARRHGYRCVLGSIYPWDAHLGHGRLVTADVLRRARPGAIVILHEGRPDRSGVVDMLDTLLAGLADRGLRTVSVSTLLAAAKAS